MEAKQITLGIERLCTEDRQVLQGKRLGLVMNQASVTSDLRYSCDALADAFPNDLRAIFSPQHGFWCEQQANMIETDHARHPKWNVPIYSLYGETRWPTHDMLSQLDCLVVDLQDVGTRVYTYIWTLSHCLEECAKKGVEVIVADRPNPLGCDVIEGPAIQPGYESFVGRYPIPMRHGMTIGDFATWANHEFRFGADLRVLSVEGWNRSDATFSLDRLWIPPSPNMPRWETAWVYPGQVLLEGTNLSEGRGTTRPFEVVGAPFIDPNELLAALSKFEFPGLKLLPIRFVPTFDKWNGQSCGGIAIYITDPDVVRSYELSVRLIETVARLWPEEFAFLPPPYEYETEKMPIDILSGSQHLREAIERGESLDRDDENIFGAEESK